MDFVVSGTMENSRQPLMFSRENENACDHIAELSSDKESFLIGQKMLSSTTSISLSAEELRSLHMVVDEDSVEEYPPRLENQEDDQKPEATSSAASTSSKDPKANGKSDSQWKGFLRKLSKGPITQFQTFHPTLPHLSSIRKFSRRRSVRTTQSLPSLPPHLDAELYHYFENSWKNFTLADLSEATNDFSQDNLIGVGGYSEVYKGHLEDGQLVAVKRLIRGTQEEMTADYLSELGILVHVNHPNIASVIGYGVEGGMHLVLPLSPNGSLASLLNGEKEKLGWGSRYNIAIGIASGLSYLHEGCHRRIIHRDIKSANVLLTEDFEPQISDFGLAKWLPDQWSHITVSQVEGTFGYLPPEFFMHGLVDEKTDVYAFGVLLLELISGRPALDEAHNSVLMWAKPLIISKSIAELADPSLDGVYDWEQLNRMVMVASLCIHIDSTERPNMSKVLKMLKGEEGMLHNKKQFNKRPGLRRTHPLELITEEESYTDKSCNGDRNQKNETALDQEDYSINEENSLDTYDVT